MEEIGNISYFFRKKILTFYPFEGSLGSFLPEAKMNSCHCRLNASPMVPSLPRWREKRTVAITAKTTMVAQNHIQFISTPIHAHVYHYLRQKRQMSRILYYFQGDE